MVFRNDVVDFGQPLLIHLSVMKSDLQHKCATSLGGATATLRLAAMGLAWNESANGRKGSWL